MVTQRSCRITPRQWVDGVTILRELAAHAVVEILLIEYIIHRQRCLPSAIAKTPTSENQVGIELERKWRFDLRFEAVFNRGKKCAFGGWVGVE